MIPPKPKVDLRGVDLRRESLPEVAEFQPGSGRGGYVNIGMSAGFPIAVSFGVKLGPNKIQPYMGANISTNSGLGGSITYSSYDLSPGCSVDFSAFYGLGGGISHDGDSWQWEAGLGTPGMNVGGMSCDL